MWEIELLCAIGHWAFNNVFTILLFLFLTIIVVLLNAPESSSYVLIAKIDEANNHLHHIQKELEAINRREKEANDYLYHIENELKAISPRPDPSGAVSGVWYRCTNDPDEKLQHKSYSPTGVVLEDQAREDAEQNCRVSFSGHAYHIAIMFRNGALKEIG